MAIKESIPEPFLNHLNIQFSKTVYGKPNKNRKQDPSMFELLSWQTDGLDKHSFKKKENFKDPTQVYLNIIAKQPWTTESQQNYFSCNANQLPVNTDLFSQIENYIEGRAPSTRKPKREKGTPNQSSVIGPASQSKTEVGPAIQSRKAVGPAIQTKIVVGPAIQTQVNTSAERHYSPSKYTSPKRRRINQREYQILKNNPTEPVSKSFQRSGKKPIVQTQKTGENTKSKQGGVASSKIKTQACQDRSSIQRVENKGYDQNLLRHQQKPQLSQKQQSKLIEKFKQTTRWIPNSAFTTYFGKPPFENYGRGNTQPTDGGLGYGTYMYSHNVHPHRGKNQPAHLQSYPVALMKAKSQGTLVPSCPRTQPETAGAQYAQDHCIPISPRMNNYIQVLNIVQPDMYQMTKFGASKKAKDQIQTQ